MSVRTEVGVVSSECLKLFSGTRKDFADGVAPSLLAFIFLGVPSVGRHAVDGYQRRFGMLHRIGDETRHAVGDVEVVAIDGTHQQVVAHIVGHGEVPPDVRRTLDAFVYPLDARLGDVRNHAVARPHDLDARVELGSERGEVVALRVRPTLVVFRGTHHERSHVRLRLHEMFVDVVQQFRLLHGIGSLAGDVVEEHGERAHAEVVHLLELGEQEVAVAACPLDVKSRMDCPHEVHGILFRHLHQLLDLLRLLFGIGQTPVGGTVVGVVLRTVDVGVHLVLAVEFQLAEACLVAPRRSVEALHHAAEADARIVGDVRHGEAVLLQQPAEGLQGVERAALVIAGKHDFFRTDAEEIALLLVRDEAAELPDSLVAPFADVDARAFPCGKVAGKQGFQVLHGVGIGGVLTDEAVGAVQGDCSFGKGDFLRSRLHVDALCRQAHACHHAEDA